MGIISTILGAFGFGFGTTVGIVIGYYLFIYHQSTDVQAFSNLLLKYFNLFNHISNLQLFSRLNATHRAYLHFFDGGFEKLIIFACTISYDHFLSLQKNTCVWFDRLDFWNNMGKSDQFNGLILTLLENLKLNSLNFNNVH